VFVFSWVYCHPEQFVPIGEAFFKQANVLIPLLPGHGLAGNERFPAPPSLEIQRPINSLVFTGYTCFGETGLGRAIWWHISSLASTPERPQQIDAGVCPYLSGSNKVVDLFVRILNIYLSGRLNLESAFWLRWLSDASTRSLLGHRMFSTGRKQALRRQCL